MEILVIIDMQGNFKASQDPKTISNIVGLIQQFRAKEDPIILLEYQGEQKYTELTCPEIYNALRGYQEFILLRKSRDDGTKEINRAFKAFPEWQAAESMVFCGVNTGACVEDTVEGCSLVFPEKMMLVDLAACNCTYFDKNQHWLSQQQNIVFRKAA